MRDQTHSHDDFLASPSFFLNHVRVLVDLLDFKLSSPDNGFLCPVEGGC